MLLMATIGESKHWALLKSRQLVRRSLDISPHRRSPPVKENRFAAALKCASSAF